MTRPFRSILALSVVAIVLAACSTTAAPASEAPDTSQPATPVVEPSVEPSEAPTVEPQAPSQEPAPADREVDGILTVYPGTWSGAGKSIQEALDAGPTGSDVPTIVNGVLFRDTDGRIYLATSVSDASVPAFDGPMLEVLDYANDGDPWDMANAEMLGLEEANGIVFREDTDILGTLELP